MENKVGAAVPTGEQFSQWVKQAEELKKDFGKYGTVLDNRQVGSNMRQGGERFIQMIHDTAREYHINIKGMPLDGMLADFKLFQETPALERAVAELHQMVSDTRLQSGAECWQALLGYYGALSAVASRDPELAKRLEPLTEFMAASAKGKKGK